MAKSAKRALHQQLDSMQKLEAIVNTKKAILLNKAIGSNNPKDILKANEMLKNVEPLDNEGVRKSYLVDPYQFNQFLGYKNKPYSLSYQMLRRISYVVPIVRAIINTRIDQITSFVEPQKDKYSMGFVIRKKRSYYGIKDQKEPSKEELLKAEKMTEFILNCGVGNNFDADDFDAFTRKLMNDSYMYDQCTFEIERNQRGMPCAFYAVDASTIRIADSYDNQDYDINGVQAPQYGSQNNLDRKKVKGYYPSFSQIKQGVIHTDFYPWEMSFGIRNPVTDIYANGYGISEIEVLMNICTSMLYSDEYNRRFFSQGSAPKGFIKVKSGSLLNNTKLQDFKQAWQAMVAGVVNAHKTPVLEGDVEWVDLQLTNRDMEFAKWQEYLIKLSCAIYRIDPAEINFPLSGSSGAKMVYEGNNEARLKHSKDKGLYPALKFLQRKINKYLISQMDPEYEFCFVGMDGVDIGDELDQDIKMLTNFMTLDEVRVRRGLKPLGAAKGGDLILNAAYMQQKQMEQQAEMQSQQMETQTTMHSEKLDASKEQTQMTIDAAAEEEKDDPFEKAFNSYLVTLNN